MAILRYSEGKTKEAESLYLQMLGVYERLFPAGHPDIKRACNNISAFYKACGNIVEAEKFSLRSTS